MKEEIKRRCDVAFKTNDEVDELSQSSVSTLTTHASHHPDFNREAKKKSKLGHGQPTKVQRYI